jgi:hypothetical protein
LTTIPVDDTPGLNLTWIDQNIGSSQSIILSGYESS